MNKINFDDFLEFYRRVSLKSSIVSSLILKNIMISLLMNLFVINPHVLEIK